MTNGPASTSNERPTIVILGASAEDPPPGLEPAFELADVHFAPDGEALRTLMVDADALLSWGAPPGWLSGVWELADRLRWIHSASDGVDQLLFPALVTSDVLVTNARGVFDAPIAEWAIGAILAFATGLRTSILDTATGTWDGERSRGRVAGQRLLIVGPGPIGEATATCARAFGMQVSAVGRSARDHHPVFGRELGPEDLHRAR